MGSANTTSLEIMIAYQFHITSRDEIKIDGTNYKFYCDIKNNSIKALKNIGDYSYVIFLHYENVIYETIIDRLFSRETYVSNCVQSGGLFFIDYLDKKKSS
jgi:hypothetical protein